MHCSCIRHSSNRSSACGSVLKNETPASNSEGSVTMEHRTTCSAAPAPMSTPPKMRMRCCCRLQRMLSVVLLATCSGSSVLSTRSLHPRRCMVALLPLVAPDVVSVRPGGARRGQGELASAPRRVLGDADASGTLAGVFQGQHDRPRVFHLRARPVIELAAREASLHCRQQQHRRQPRPPHCS